MGLNGTDSHVYAEPRATAIGHRANVFGSSLPGLPMALRDARLALDRDPLDVTNELVLRDEPPEQCEVDDNAAVEFGFQSSAQRFTSSRSGRSSSTNAACAASSLR